MTNHRNEKYNESGCADKTAYEAIRNIRREERRNLIFELKAFANKRGYKIVSTIRLKEMDGEDW
ncbi:hypothetical protein [Ructibacterium gallinarum]|uniref:Uncharacterized protein n=1 Tax=Ructibacterium gallinarum TaxID=2779355 RepID=A0A9D5RCH7_9FIRM|nr:hypothetical protein [Ructibacterium gallinarum]MBE5041008.1 hypothetical protein [Ructibacterium gallinarum]